jgi:hypothetical protein
MRVTPSHRRPRRRLLLAVAVTPALALATALATPPAPVAAVSPAASFTHNVRADGQDKANSGQNEPQVTVDRTGLAYVTWQTAAGPPSPVTTTRDGRHFSPYTIPDGHNHFDIGDVALAHTSYPAVGHPLPAGPPGANGVFFAQLGLGTCGPIGIRAATSTDQGRSWKIGDATCQPCQVDRPWIAAYTPPAYRDTAQATSRTQLYAEHHDFCASNVWVTSSGDGGTTWNTTPVNAEEPGSPAQLTSLCNSIPGGIAVAQGGPHAGRVFAVWSTSDPFINGLTGCNYSQFQPFDHIFISYSDDGGATWTSRDVFDDACDTNPPQPPASAESSPPVGTCQDVSELFDAVASDDSGNMYVAYTARLLSEAQPEYDTYVASSTDGGDTWTSRKVNSDTGTHYAPWIAAGGDGGVDVVYYDTPFVEGVGNLNKPADAPPTAIWYVDMSQSLDGGRTWAQSRVSDHPVYFGDYCTTGISCGTALSGINNWGGDRILFDDFGVAIGPDGGARIVWTDAHDSWKGACAPGANANVSCQTTHVYFACQKGGVGLHGEAITGCGAVGGVAAASATGSGATATPHGPAATTPVAALPNTGATAPDGRITVLLLLGLAAPVWLFGRRRRVRAG